MEEVPLLDLKTYFIYRFDALGIFKKNKVKSIFDYFERRVLNTHGVFHVSTRSQMELKSIFLFLQRIIYWFIISAVNQKTLYSILASGKIFNFCELGFYKV